MTFAVSSSSPLSTRCSAAGLRGGGSSPDATSPTRTRTALSSAKKHRYHINFVFGGNFEKLICVAKRLIHLFQLSQKNRWFDRVRMYARVNISGAAGGKRKRQNLWYGMALGIAHWNGMGRKRWQWLNMYIIIINSDHAELTKWRGADVKQAINTFVPIICSNDGGSMTCRKEDVSPLSI